jgi:hypothetical protein
MCNRFCRFETCKNAKIKQKRGGKFFKEDKLERGTSVEIFAESTNKAYRPLQYYNLDMIIIDSFPIKSFKTISIFGLLCYNEVVFLTNTDISTYLTITERHGYCYETSD